MKRERHTTDEVIRKLREAETIEAAGASRSEVLQKLAVSEQTLSRWRQSFKGMGDEQIKRLKGWRRNAGAFARRWRTSCRTSRSSRR